MMAVELEVFEKLTSAGVWRYHMAIVMYGCLVLDFLYRLDWSKVSNCMFGYMGEVSARLRYAYP
jgi:hypothetical protein